MLSKLTFCKLLNHVRATRDIRLCQILEESTDVAWGDELWDKAFYSSVPTSEVYDDVVVYILKHNYFLHTPVYKVADLFENVIRSDASIVLMVKEKDPEDPSTMYYKHVFKGQGLQLINENSPLLKREVKYIHNVVQDKSFEDYIFVEITDKEISEVFHSELESEDLTMYNNI